MQVARVYLDDHWQSYAEWVAFRRQDTAPAHQVHGCTGGLAEHLMGACGEVAFGLWLYQGRPFRLTVGTYRARPDFPGTEVRTRGAGHWDLLVRRDDDPSFAYVLAVPYGSGGRHWRLAGWLWGHQARRPRWLASHGQREQAWFVPQGELSPMSTYRERS
jgi:hypothetical protein